MSLVPSMRKEKLPKVVSEPGAWMEKMRNALFDGVSELDMTAIMKKQVEKAKGGDSAAAKFVIDLVAGKPAANQTLIIHEAPKPEAPTTAKQGTREKIDVMRDRASRGLSLHHESDGTT